MRINTKPATKGLYRHSYAPCSVLSLDFSDLQPTLRIDVVPDDKWNKVHGSGSLLLAPQIFPAYGKLFVKNASFFVPESQLVEYAEAFHNNQNSWKGHAVVRPLMPNTEINSMFYAYRSTATPVDESKLSYEIASGTVPNTVINSNNLTDDDYDFVHITGSTGSVATYHFMKLTRYGKKLFKVLKSLGYDFPSFGYYSGNTYNDILAATQDDIDILPILAYAKIYCDYFLPGSMYNSNLLVAFLRAIHCGDSSFSDAGVTYYSSSKLNFTGLYYILSNICVPYERNMYTEAWNTPNSPLGVSPESEMINLNGGGAVSPFLPSDPQTSKSGVISADANNIEYLNYQSGTISTLGYLSNFGLNLLNSAYKFVKRNNLFGSNSIDRFFARFGIKSPDYDNGRARKLSEGSERVVFHPIYSNADTETTGSSDGKTLGSFSGMAYSGLNVSFNYKSSEYGYIICLSWINIVPILKRGFDPSVLRKYPFDFWTPEYDGKALRAIPMCEVSTNQRSTDNLVQNGDKKIFGFTNLYQEYRQLRDVIAGDFVFGANTKNFAFTRDFSVLRMGRSITGLHPQSNAVQLAYRSHPDDMSDPFQMSNSLGDRFYLFLDWELDAERPILPDSDAIDLSGSGDLSLPVNGSQMA